jgi:phage/plasmid-associated DNA primase
MCGEVERFAKETVEDMHPTRPSRERRHQVGDSQTRPEVRVRRRAKNILEIAKSEKGIVVAPDAFDQNKFLFNVQNGTLDLSTGILQEHDPADMITMISPATWDGLEAKAPIFDRFLNEAQANNPDRIAFLARLCGYTLTGYARTSVRIPLRA